MFEKIPPSGYQESSVIEEENYSSGVMMKKISPLMLLLVFVAITFLVTTEFSLAGKRAESYEEWLENYNAYDRLENEIKNKPEDNSPDALLKRAKVYLQLGTPQKALNLIEMTPAFEDKSAEARRLWYGGQAHRAKGDIKKAVFWFTQASKFMDAQQRREFFHKEHDLDVLWQDVWRQLYWTYSANFTLSKKTQLGVLKDILEAAQATWSDSFWESAHAVYQFESTGKTDLLPARKIKTNKDGTPLPAFVTDEDKHSIAQLLGALALEDFEQAKEFTKSISKEPVANFWHAFGAYVEYGSRPEDLSLFQGYNKARAFWAGHVLAPYSSRNNWVLGSSDAEAWTRFRDKLLAMEPNAAREAIEKELGSLLISEQTTALLQGFRLAFSLMTNDFDVAQDTWNQVDQRALPIPLQVAGIVSFGGPLGSIMPKSASAAQTRFPITINLCGAAGHDLRPGIEAPFWEPLPVNRLKRAAKDNWPMDRLVLLAYWQNTLNKKPNSTLARRAAFTFRDSSFGVNSLLYLIDSAIRAKNTQLASFYLTQLSEYPLDKENHARFLEAKTRLELSAGKQEKALATYKELTATDESIPAFTRLRMALLMQQRGELRKARTQLLSLWAEKDNHPTAMQAEILFWLGEGEQAMRNVDAALDHYLHLAWQYPQENIWALTAMYRASMIYEKKGQFATAKKLLKTVIKRADRKEQREAAKARLAAIESKSGGKKAPKGLDDSAISYPF